MDLVCAKNPGLSRLLELYRLLLLSREELENDPNKGLSVSLDEGLVKALQKEAENAGKPITHQLRGDMFCLKPVLKTIDSIVGALARYGFNEELRGLTALLSGDQALLIRLLNAALRSDEEELDNLKNVQ
ncbi:MAG: hypothetical protein QXQ28_04035 [Candidatus Nezhaarchaeales archaeon]